MILIVGSPRSGTTWLAKIFDSHPDVLYRHEPDGECSTNEFPYIVPLESIPQYRDDAKTYLEALPGVRTLKAAASRPYFHKSFRSDGMSFLRGGIVLGLRVAEKLGPIGRPLKGRSIPDFIQRSSIGPSHTVIKSVIALGRLRLFREAMSDLRSIIILRHPCAHVGSYTRGMKARALGGRVAIGALSQTQEAKSFGLTLDVFERMDLLEQIAWSWVLLNQKALLENAGSDNVAVVRHEDLCVHPQAVVRDLFEFSALPWSPQTDTFINSSSKSSGASGYFDLKRDSVSEVDRWKNMMAVDDIERIMRIARDTVPGRYYF